jgi:hypothetical protein
MCRLRLLTFLALSQPREAFGTVSAARTDCESITAAVGSASRPAAALAWAAADRPAGPGCHHRARPRSSRRRSATAGSRRAGTARRTRPGLCTRSPPRSGGRARPAACLATPARIRAGAGRSPATGHRSDHWDSPWLAVRSRAHAGHARALVLSWSSHTGIMGPAPGISTERHTCGCSLGGESLPRRRESRHAVPLL